MKKVMIYAYANFNLGDDLFIKVLCERYPNTKFYIYAPKQYKVLFKGMDNLSIVSSDTIFSRGINYIFRKLEYDNVIPLLISKYCDAVINIGGSIFIQNKNWRKNLKTRRMLRNGNKPFFLLGANFGPFTDEEFYTNYRKEISEYTDVCFRDEYSYGLFKDLGNVRLADDIIFQLKKQELNKTDNANSILISVIEPSFRKNLEGYDEVYYNKLKDISLYFIKRGYKVLLMSFCKNEGDERAVKKIMDLIPKDKLSMVTKHEYRENIDDALNAITNTTAVIATRFHSMILGWVFNKPVFPITYSGKMKNVIKDVGFKGNYTDFNSISSLNPEDVFKFIETNKIDVSRQIKKSMEHFKVLDKYLS
ncbi:polysaccharide pyruvyl transferase family protein [Lederbergia ruris]|uniref:polysaccharide pyruvyl transferase family protein n=1 Tax=Lederbergia ruris TaxID=217495 RepID=UPI0039A3F7DC